MDGKLLKESYFINMAKSVLLYFKEAYFASFLCVLIRFLKEKILNSKFIKIIFDTSVVASLWYKSFFYRLCMYRIRKVSFSIKRPTIKFNSYLIGIFIMGIILLPDFLWSGFVWIPLFLSLAMLYISHNIRERVGTVFVLINIILALFLLISFSGLSYLTAKTLAYLIFGVDIFFMISFAIRTKEDLDSVLFYLFTAALVLCGVGFLKSILFSLPINAVYSDSVKLGEVLVLIFPFVFMCPPSFKSNTRKYLYQAFIFIIFSNIITETHSKAAFIGFWVEVLIIILTNIRYLPFMIMLLPFGLGTALSNIGELFEAVFENEASINIISLFRQFWKYGFGISSETVMNIYGTDAIKLMPYAHTQVVYEIGMIFLILLLAYILRLAHSTLTAIFSSDKRYKVYFSAGLSMLVGISVASFVETSLFSSRTMLVYWIMLGILRSVRILKLGVYEA